MMISDELKCCKHTGWVKGDTPYDTCEGPFEASGGGYYATCSNLAGEDFNFADA